MARFVGFLLLIDLVAAIAQYDCPDTLYRDRYLQVRGNKCYYFFLNLKLDYGEASSKCHTKGGTLAMVKSKQLNQFLHRHLQYTYMDETRNKDTRVWIGLDDLREEGHFRWADDSSLEYQNFASLAGTNAWISALHDPTDCVAMEAKSGLWYDYKCESVFLLNEKKPFICEVPAIPNRRSTLEPSTRVPAKSTSNSILTSIITTLQTTKTTPTTHQILTFSTHNPTSRKSSPKATTEEILRSTNNPDRTSISTHTPSTVFHSSERHSHSQGMVTQAPSIEPSSNSQTVQTFTESLSVKSSTYSPSKVHTVTHSTRTSTHSTHSELTHSPSIQTSTHSPSVQTSTHSPSVAQTSTYSPSIQTSTQTPSTQTPTHSPSMKTSTGSLASTPTTSENSSTDWPSTRSSAYAQSSTPTIAENTTSCPALVCEKACGMDGFATDPHTGCLLCQCAV